MTRITYWAVVGILFLTSLPFSARCDFSSELFNAARKGLHSRCEELKRQGTDVNGRISGLTMLTMALNQKDRRAAKILLTLGANPNLDELVSAPLNLAIDLHFYELIPLLLQKGASPNHQSMFGLTALHTAAAEGDGILCALLLEHGAKTHIRDQNGLTPILYAQRNGKRQILAMLRGDKVHMRSYLSSATFRTNLALSITNGATMKRTYSGYADKPGISQRWPFNLRIVKLHPETGHFTGFIDWKTMASRHEITGKMGAKSLVIKEGRVFKKGLAYVGTEHTFPLTTPENFHPHHLVGTWRHKSEYGAVYLDFTSQ